MNPEQHDYSFLYQGESKGASNNPAPKNKKQNIMLIAFSLLGVIIVAVLASFIIGIFRVDNTQKLTDLVTYQNELQRIMQIGVADSSGGSVKALAQTAASTFASQKQTTLSLATKRGIKITEKQLALGKSAATDTKLESAKSANNFDEVFQKLYEEKIIEYTSKLNALNAAESEKDIKAALVNYLNSISLMSVNYTPKSQ